MQKPITIERQEFAEALVDVVNKSELPLIIIEPIIKNLLDEIRNGIKKQTEIDQAEYAKYLAEQKEKTEEDLPDPKQEE